MSLFTLGTMRAVQSPQQMLQLLRAALAAGINHLETAPAYGPAEAFLGKALAQLIKEGASPADGGWVITSKPSEKGQEYQHTQSVLAKRDKRWSLPPTS